MRPLNFLKSANATVVSIVFYDIPADVVVFLSVFSRLSVTDFEIIIVENAGSTAFDRLAAVLQSAFPLQLYAHNAVIDHVHGTTIGSATTMGARSNLSIYLMQRNKLLLTLVHFFLLYPLVVLVTFCLTFDDLIRGNRRIFATAWRGWCAGPRGETGRPVCV